MRSLRRRLEALEAALLPRPEPYEVALERAILERRAIPLPPLDGVDLDATAELWARGGGRCGFVMADGARAASMSCHGVFTTE